jgi:hypothetical protein
MNYKSILRNKPWLKLYNGNNISKRLMKSTNNNAFIVYNLIKCNYELHTIQAEHMSGDSYNATIPIEVLNQWIIEDYNSTDFEKYVDDLVSAKQKAELLSDIQGSESRRQQILKDQLKVVERVFGTKL